MKADSFIFLCVLSIPVSLLLYASVYWKFVQHLRWKAAVKHFSQWGPVEIIEFNSLLDQDYRLTYYTAEGLQKKDFWFADGQIDNERGLSYVKEFLINQLPNKKSQPEYKTIFKSS